MNAERSIARAVRDVERRIDESRLAIATPRRVSSIFEFAKSIPTVAETIAAVIARVEESDE